MPNDPWIDEYEADLARAGVPPNIRRNVLENATPQNHSRFLANPYVAARWSGMNFQKVDRGVQEFKLMPPDAPERITACAMDFLQSEANREGHTWASGAAIHAAIRQNLRGATIAETDLAHIFGGEIKELTGDRFALPDLHEDELYVAKTLARLAKTPSRLPDTGRRDPTLTPEQRAGVDLILKSSVSLMTGGPGCGKTYTLAGVINAIGDDDVCLCAPTGKAAKLMADRTKKPASTIHSLLNRIENDGRNFHTLVIDETSMVDVTLMAKLLRAVESDKAPIRILMVGDNDQLPSIEAGRIFGDMIESKRIPTVRLTKIMRQEEGSQITQNANNILNGRPIQDFNAVKGSDFFTTFGLTNDKMAAAIRTGIFERLPQRTLKSGKKCDPLRDVLVLTPQHQGPFGTVALNAMFQAHLNPPSPEKHERPGKANGADFTYRDGDKVMITKNMSQHRVVNGDVGFIKSLKSNMVIEFKDGKLVSLEGADSNNVSPGYAVTVHKAQGSESPVVVALYPDGMSTGMRSRNHIYTAVTRARETAWVVGSERTVNECIANNRPSTRRTTAAETIRQIIPTEIVPVSAAPVLSMPGPPASMPPPADGGPVIRH